MIKFRFSFRVQTSVCFRRASRSEEHAQTWTLNENRNFRNLQYNALIFADHFRRVVSVDIGEGFINEFGAEKSGRVGIVGFGKFD